MATRSRGRIHLLRRLGLYGLDHLDVVVLAALADERPLLLVGPHGTAKSELLNSLARELGLRHRHYNASLLSFDDLVGYPVPDRETGRMEFLETPAAIWGAQSVFLDEISRCRPETANKLFSIVHEARVQGLELPDLRYRWAAMNPPVTDEDDDGGDAPPDDPYLGSVPLDPALADRFAWVVEVPSLTDLSVAARRDVIARGGERSPRGPGLVRLVEETRAAFAGLGAAERSWAVSLVEAVIDPLREANLPISGRRAVFLRDSILWALAAGRTLRARTSLADAAMVALTHGLPQRAQGRKIRPAVIRAIHRSAVEVAGEPGDSLLRAIRAEKDPVRRIALALEAPPTALDRGTVSRLVSDALAGLPKPRRWALSLLLLRHPGVRRLDAPTLELLAQPMEKLAALGSERELNVRANSSRSRTWNDVLAAIGDLEAEGDPDADLVGNLLYALFAIEEETFEPARVIAAFREWRDLLESGEARNAA